ncbi:MAG: N-acetylmuramoyl-L-alanine amidase [Lachnospiraceae bacterium]|nr:N-acetylmuramoyl-L-alanine amidase [Lachnospiraceae bacterium]
MQHSNDNFARLISRCAVLILCFCMIFLTACSTSHPQDKQTDSSKTENKGNTGKQYTVFLDAGHGGKEAGGRTKDIMEKDINLQIMEKVRDFLYEDGFQIAMARSEDMTVSLKDRISMAQEAKADVFVSIHQNSLDNDTVTSGIKTYCSEEAGKKNNKLASLVHKSVLKTTGAKDRGIEKNSKLYVLVNNKIPSCLIETGFITAEEEGRLLTQNDYQEKIARGIADAVKDFLTGKSKNSSSDKASDESSNESSDNEASKQESNTQSSQESESDTSNESDESSREPQSGEEESSGEESSADKNGITTSGEPNDHEKVVYITIDDGPTTGTPEILDILDQYDAKATWFVTGQYMEGSALKDMIKQVHDRGHAVGVHTFSHVYTNIYSSVDNYMKDYNKMNSIIINATGEDSKLFRFPGGSNAGYNRKIRSQLLKHVKSEGLVYYDWNAFTGDTEGFSASQMVSKAVKECSYNNKSILLMHDVPGKHTVVEALPRILSELKSKGYEFRALDKNVKPIQFEK